MAQRKIGTEPSLFAGLEGSGQFLTVARGAVRGSLRRACPACCWHARRHPHFA
jgi:hypothetical protein